MKEKSITLRLILLILQFHQQMSPLAYEPVSFPYLQEYLKMDFSFQKSPIYRVFESHRYAVSCKVNLANRAAILDCTSDCSKPRLIRKSIATLLAI